MDRFIPVLFEPLFYGVASYVENKNSSISRSNCNVFSAVAESGSSPIATNMKLVITTKQKKREEK